MPGTVVLLGTAVAEDASLQEMVMEFGWSLEKAAGMDQLRDMAARRSPVAILFDPGSLGMACEDALRSVLKIAPHALPIPCYRFSDIVNWPELADAGAFHALALPLNPSEVRQSLGFVWSARISRAANVLSISAAERRNTMDKCPSADTDFRAAGSVA